MKHLIRDMPIRRKLTILSVFSSSVALLVVIVTIAIYEGVTFRRQAALTLSTTAQMTGSNCAAALSFRDVHSAEQTLKALEAQPHIRAACVYDSEGGVFAGYSRDAAVRPAWPALQANGARYGSDALEVFQGINNAGEEIGSIYIRSDLVEMRSRLRSYAIIAIEVLIAAILMAWFLAARLQRVISEPVSELASIAGRVATDKDYSLRAVKRSNDELGRLIDGFNEMLGQIQTRDAKLQRARDELETRVEERTEALRKEGAELDNVHRQLLEVSRQAGMAEVATGVLHNVGNVLNSVNVSATLVSDQVRHSKIINIGRISKLLREHKADIGAFIAEDPKGRIIPPYLETLSEILAAEQKTMIEELDNLRKNIDHIKDIVTMQQSYAKASGVAETISLPDLVEDALRMNAGSLSRHDVDVVRDYRDRPVVTVEKNKVLQVLINLVRNAKYACDESGRTGKVLTVRTTANERGVSIAVMDNGVGIPQENLTRIFAHGFTTRKDGHGFGLHSGALAAKEMGGTLTGHSAGPGKGATFTLELPYKSEAINYEKHAP